MAARLSISGRPYRTPRPATRFARRGFMLIEAAITTIIVGLAIVALLTVMGAGSNANGGSRDLVRATFLAQEIREMLAPLPVEEEDGVYGTETGESWPSGLDDLFDFDGRQFSPPVNAQRETLYDTQWQGWQQTVTVENVDPNYLQAHSVLADGSTDMVRVTVRIFRDYKLVHQISWLVAEFAETDAGGG